MKKSIKDRVCPDPNREVEKWKDKAYKEIKGLPIGKVGEYMERRADEIFRRYGISVGANKYT